MKRQLVFIYSIFCLLISNFVVIPAKVEAFQSTTEEKNDFYQLNETEMVVKGFSVNQLGYSDGKELYIVTFVEDKMIVTNGDGNILASANLLSENKMNQLSSLSMSELKFNNSILLTSTANTWDVWRDEIPTEYASFVPTYTTNSIAANILASMISAALTAVTGGSALLIISSGACSYLAGAIADTVVNGETIYVKGYVRYNTYCDILKKDKVKQFYSPSGNVKKVGRENITWLSTPWDYATASAYCRALTELYPY